jgi:hypothetical protein
MKALISPNEVVETGYRVAEVCENEFEVAEPLFWLDCPNTVSATEYFYDPSSTSFQLIPVPVAPEQVFVSIPNQPQPISQGAQTL